MKLGDQEDSWRNFEKNFNIMENFPKYGAKQFKKKGRK